MTSPAPAAPPGRPSVRDLSLAALTERADQIVDQLGLVVRELSKMLREAAADDDTAD